MQGRADGRGARANQTTYHTVANTFRSLRIACVKPDEVVEEVDGDRDVGHHQMASSAIAAALKDAREDLAGPHR